VIYLPNFLGLAGSTLFLVGSALARTGSLPFFDEGSGLAALLGAIGFEEGPKIVLAVLIKFVKPTPTVPCRGFRLGSGAI